MPHPPLVAPVAALSESERRRTARHAVLAGFGELGQRRLAAAHVAVVGAGGLGSPAVLALAAAGVGTITVVDDDLVEHTNLQRQVLHRVVDIGAPKVDSAVRAAADLSPETIVRPVRVRLDADNAADVLAGAHVVLDGTDTFETRRVVAAACERLGVPLVWGVVQEFHAQVTVFWSAPPAGADAVVLDDLYPAESVGEVPSCAQAGVLGALTLQVGAIMATQAIALIAGVGEPLLGRVLVVDALTARTHEVPLRAAAGRGAHAAAGTVEGAAAGASSGDAGAAAQAAVRVEPAAAPASAPPAMPARLTLSEMLQAQAAGATVLDVREPHETADGVVAGSAVIPLAELLADPAAAGEGPFVVVCAHGTRADRAARALRARGREADILDGGLFAWVAS
ncbi:HesA/MoeB/ThiF family protein [Microbacterium sp. No. 7]|uniref:HesA/MoeB/ThiF family protein n=1 Tax=Microbacterium sp. No. 7 TaxID=1714373 RepID=UPI0006CFCB10|nr:HesA/MoeB/ThiF family protein [Microbacterium sp. No. 7]ALJ22232.1 thiamine biosynthesis protein ThiF [Microbacterium sp. No. 7]